MSNGVRFFVKPCPSCGRNSKICLSYLGKEVRCRHCLRVFLADDASGRSEAMNDPIGDWARLTIGKSGDVESNAFERTRRPR